MIRVGFIVSFTGSGWVGGLNYYRTLLQALSDSEVVQPVVLAGPNIPDSILAELPKVELIRTRLVAPRDPLMKARKVAEAFYGRAFILEDLLERHGISVLSHSGHLGPRSAFPSIGWIPDFQHQRLPNFFSEADRTKRDRGYARLADFCSRIVVSSEDARNDLIKFRPTAAHKADVLHFVPHAAPADATPMNSLAIKYDLGTEYFHLPNQFWVHKNHRVVIDALAELEKRGRKVTVVATGATTDPRTPDHFATLMQHLEQSGQQRNFRVLGLVPFADLLGLMQNAVALINPSHFEGWSTSVEEAKSIGKSIILSDIPVHREQAPPFARYFPPDDSQALANAISEALDTYSPSLDAQQQKQAQGVLPQRVEKFARDYESIVERAAAKPSPRSKWKN